MQDLKSRLESLGNRIKEKTFQRERLQGQYDAAMKTLKEMGYGSVEEAVSASKDLQKEIDTLEDKLEKATVELEEAINALESR